MLYEKEELFGTETFLGAMSVYLLPMFCSLMKEDNSSVVYSVTQVYAITYQLV